MDGSIRLAPKERKIVLEYYRKARDPAIRLRAHILLLLAEDYSWREIAGTLFTSTRARDRWKRRFEQKGIDAVIGQPRGRPVVFLVWWMTMVVRWVTSKTPRDFGFLRSRWSCATVVLLLWEEQRIRVSTETIRRWLHRENL